MTLSVIQYLSSSVLPDSNLMWQSSFIFEELHLIPSMTVQQEALKKVNEFVMSSMARKEGVKRERDKKNGSREDMKQQE